MNRINTYVSERDVSVRPSAPSAEGVGHVNILCTIIIIPADVLVSGCSLQRQQKRISISPFSIHYRYVRQQNLYRKRIKWLIDIVDALHHLQFTI